MGVNFLEQMVSEWYEYNGYYVRRNVLVGKRPKGGYECELDVVAFHPGKKHLLQIEPSMDSASWANREHRYKKKFEAGKKYIPQMFKELCVPTQIDQVALLFYASSTTHNTIGGGRIQLVDDFVKEILKELCAKRVHTDAVPEQFTILRAFQFASRVRLNG